MYGKIWEMMYTGSLLYNGDESWKAIVTFQQMIILADKDGIVTGNLESLHRKTTVPHDVLEVGIRILEAPDPQSRSRRSEGKRIIRQDNWGWKIVNYKAFRDARDEHVLKAYWAEQKRKTRQKATEE